MGELIANKLLHLPMSALKAGEQAEVEVLVEVTKKLFALDAALDKEPAGGEKKKSA